MVLDNWLLFRVVCFIEAMRQMLVCSQPGSRVERLRRATALLWEQHWAHPLCLTFPRLSPPPPATSSPNRVPGGAHRSAGHTHPGARLPGSAPLRVGAFPGHASRAGGGGALCPVLTAAVGSGGTRHVSGVLRRQTVPAPSPTPLCIGLYWTLPTVARLRELCKAEQGNQG